MVERQPSKLNVAGSSLVSRSIFFFIEKNGASSINQITTYGEVSEWLKEADCKSASVSLRRFESAPHQFLNYAHVAQLVEHFLGKEEVTDSSSVVGLHPQRNENLE